MKPPVPPFYLTGEIGKPISAAPVSLESLNVDNPFLITQFGGDDSLTFYMRKPASGPWIVPEVDQWITLLDATGRRLFTGTAEREYDHTSGSAAGFHVTVTGPWKWLVKTPIQSLVADVDGVVSMRPQATFPTQALGTSIVQLFQMARDLGAPLRLAPLPSWFPVTRMTFPKDKFAEALADILKWVPDAGGRIRYDVEGPPQLEILRRAEAPRVMIELGAESNRGTKISMRAEPDMRPTSVSVQSVARDPVTFKPKFVTATAGVPDGPAYRRQLVVASGPENNTLLPTEVYENVEIQTAAAMAWSYVKTVNQELKDAIATYGDVTLDPETVSSRTFYSQDPSNGGTTWTFYTSPLALYDKDNNLLGGAWYRVTAGTPIPDWAGKDNGFVVKEGFLRGQFGGLLHRNAGSTGISLQDYSETLYRLKLQGKFWDDTVYDGPPWTSANMARYGWYAVDLPMTLISVPFDVLTTLWRKQDLDFIFPPENLHRDLWDAQKHMPWTGKGKMLPGAPMIPGPGERLNVLGGDPDWETANALVQWLKLDLAAGGAEFRIGSPPITDAASLMDRFRRSGNDNVTARA